MWQSLQILNVFNALILKQIFWKTQTLFKKLEYSFLVENSTFPYKTALSEAYINTNRMRNTKWTITKNGGLLVATFFLENFVSV